MSISPERLYGELARELGARALAWPPDAPGCWSGRGAGTLDERVGVAFDDSALAPAERSALEAIPGAVFCPGGGGPSGEGWLACGREELARAADSHPGAACLEAAVRSAEEPPGPPSFMGIVNVTPDSFSDGGRHLDPERAVEHGLRLAAEGAEILDVGGESTRPGAQPVPAEEELRRVLPVIEALAKGCRARISIDTSKAIVARAALEGGAHIVNDVSAGRADAAMLPLVAERRCELVLMHMLGTPTEMQRDPHYRDPLAEIARFLRERVAACLAAGIDARRIVLDPGIGFGKLLEHNLDLLRRLRELRSLGRPLCLGVSRKSFIAQSTGAFRVDGPFDTSESSPSDRSGGTAAALSFCISGGAEILRVHEVARSIEATAVTLAIQRRDLLPSFDALVSSPTD